MTTQSVATTKFRFESADETMRWDDLLTHVKIVLECYAKGTVDEQTYLGAVIEGKMFVFDSLTHPTRVVDVRDATSSRFYLRTIELDNQNPIARRAVHALGESEEDARITDKIQASIDSLVHRLAWEYQQRVIKDDRDQLPAKLEVGMWVSVAYHMRGRGYATVPAKITEVRTITRGKNKGQRGEVRGVIHFRTGTRKEWPIHSGNILRLIDEEQANQYLAGKPIAKTKPSAFERESAHA